MTDVDFVEAMPKVIFGCKHYKRKCAFIAPCCDKVYTCRFCHDDGEDHEIDRHKVIRLECLNCRKQQQVKKCCDGCGAEFGAYFCSVCMLFDDEDKHQFHCDKCGICRVGGIENFFHCGKCDMCLPVSCEKGHKCVEKSSRTNCPVCMEDLHTSRLPSHIPPCGHLIHAACYSDLFQTGHYCCPLCNESMIDMSKMWSYLDDEMEKTEMPTEYRDTRVQILCRDCHKESRTAFHVVGLKCQQCGSYNTCRAAEPDAAAVPPDGAAGGDDLAAGDDTAARGDDTAAGGDAAARDDTAAGGDTAAGDGTAAGDDTAAGVDATAGDDTATGVDATAGDDTATGGGCRNC